ncbi:MAG: PQQ-binding-like beta-propeller repeat protein [Pirellulales bacterium]
MKSATQSRLIVAVLLVASSMASGVEPAAYDWPDFLGPHRNAKSTETGLNWDWPTDGPPIVWQAPLGIGYSQPTVSRGRLIHFDRYGDVARLTCRDALTGEELWTLDHPTQYDDLLGYNNGPRCTPLVDGDHVYTMSAEGILQCANFADGQREWQVDTRLKFGVVQNFFGVGGTPVVFEDFIIANIGGSPPDSPPDVYSGNVQGNGSGVAAFDKLTGEVRWQATDELASYASPVIATIDGRPWCFVFARGGLVSLDPRTGNVEFQFPWRARLLESVNAATPVVEGNEVFISESYGIGGALLRVRPGGFDEVWTDRDKRRDQSMMLHWNTPVVHNGYLYGSSGRHTGQAELRCVEWKSGRVMWSEPGLRWSSLVFVDDRLLCLSEDGTLRVLRPTPEKYDEVKVVSLRDKAGHKLLREPVWVAPVVANGRLYLRGANRLVCLDVAVAK